MSELLNKTVVNSWNEWDPLKHIIIGKADYCCIPWPEPALDAKVPEDSVMKGMNGPRPQETVERANEQLDNFVRILEGRGVRVDRSEPLQWNRAIGTPDWQVNSMFGCMPPRDVLLTVGKEIIDTKTVCVEASEVHQMEQFDQLGFEVIPVPFRDAYPFGGALHCSTADVYREGRCEDYFPKQV